MAEEKNLKIVSEIASADVKLENLSGKTSRKVNGKEILMKQDGSPKIVYKTTNGDTASFIRVSNGQVIRDSSNAYEDSQGNLYKKSELIPYFETIDGEHVEAKQNEKTDVFEVTSWEAVGNYLDKYQMDTYYQVKPSHGKSKKERDRQIALNSNTSQLKKLWEHMRENGVVGRGMLNITSSGYLPTVAYLRAVEINGNKWTLEIAIFKQQKQFTWVEEQTVVAKKEPVKIEMSVDEI